MILFLTFAPQIREIKSLMLKKPLILKFYSTLFLLLTLCALLGSSVSLFVKKENSKKKEVIEKAEDSQNEDNSKTAKLTENPFHAVVNAGLQWDFSKQLYVLPVFIEFFIPEKINFVTHQFITPLAYFVTLFQTSICVNAP